jgi:16S rRNA G1207 methylase RsmC
MATLQMDTAQAFTAVRELLAACDYTAPAVCRRLGIESIYDFRSIREGRERARELESPLDLLVRLFMDVELVAVGTAEDLLSAEGVEALERLGLLTRYAADPSHCHAAVLLYPTESLWVASDLNASPDGSGLTELAPDAVYPAVTKNTRHFLSLLPPTPCRRFLELCAGTGIAALLASRYAERTWAVDITERATQFARFNAALNGITTCTALQGDLYQPVQGQQFDRIVAHPPYMPALQQRYVFRDGGEDGEQVTRAIVRGLPDHLQPGGQCHCTCMLTDRKGAPAEDRVREMLGERQSDFDLIVVSFQTFEPTEYYFRLALAGRATLDEVAQRHEVFSRMAVERLVYCSLVIERHTETRAAFTARRQAGPATGLAEVEWLRRWERDASGGAGTAARLLDSRPAPPGRLKSRLSQVLDRGAWSTDECTLITEIPFGLEAKCPPWTIVLLELADGRRTARELLTLLRERGLVPADASEDRFAALVRALIGGGFLEVADHPLPGGHNLFLTPSATARRVKNL